MVWAAENAVLVARRDVALLTPREGCCGRTSGTGTPTGRRPCPCPPCPPPGHGLAHTVGHGQLDVASGRCRAARPAANRTADREAMQREASATSSQNQRLGITATAANRADGRQPSADERRAAPPRAAGMVPRRHPHHPCLAARLGGAGITRLRSAIAVKGPSRTGSSSATHSPNSGEPSGLGSHKNNRG